MAGTQKHEALHAGGVGRVNEVGLDDEVLVDEVGPEDVVGLNAADFGRSNEEVVRALWRA